MLRRPITFVFHDGAPKDLRYSSILTKSSSPFTPLGENPLTTENHIGSPGPDSRPEFIWPRRARRLLLSGFLLLVVQASSRCFVPEPLTSMLAAGWPCHKLNDVT